MHLGINIKCQQFKGEYDAPLTQETTLSLPAEPYTPPAPEPPSYGSVLAEQRAWDALMRALDEDKIETVAS